jgi:hypothetical protein
MVEMARVIISWTCPIYSLTNTTISTPNVLLMQNVIVTGTATGLPLSTYTVTYNVSGTNSTGNTAIINVTTAGTGSFTQRLYLELR